MTKKHFIALANALRTLNGGMPVRPDACSDDFEVARAYVFQQTVYRLADFCKEQNSSFKEKRWVGYIYGECGSSGGKVK